MLAVHERSFDRERFWGPNTIKPLNFNYDFTPNLAGQNIWTLTDGLFVADRPRLSEDSGSKVALKVIFPGADYRKPPSARRKSSSRNRHFPTIDENVHQKSSSPARRSTKVKSSQSIRRGTLLDSGTNSRNSWILSSGGSLSSRVTPPLGSTGASGSHKPQQDSTSHHRPEQVFSLAKRDYRPDPMALGYKRKSNDIPERKPFPKTATKGNQKAQEQKGVSVKLSLEETERLLKSLDFRVRTRKKVTTHVRSKSERFRKKPFSLAKNSSPEAKMPFQKREVVESTTKKERFGVKKKKTPGGNSKLRSRTSENQLVRSSRQTSSDSSQKKSLSSTTGLDDLGPLPRVKWTPKERSARKRSSEKSSVRLMKAGKMKGVPLRKVTERDSPQSQDLAEVEESSQEAAVVRKVRTTPMKIIPKVTINNQLLKSTTSKNEKPQEKKAAPKTTVSKKRATSNTSNTLWTQEKIALLDQITSDQQLKAVLMSAGDTYMKSRKYLNFKMNSRSAKVPIQGNSLSTSKKKETPAETPKTSGLLKTGAKPIGSSAKLDSKSRSVSTRDQPTEGVQTEGAIDVEEKDDKAPGLTNAAASVNKTPVTKPKFEYGAKFESKPAVAVKNKTTKSPTKTVAGGHLSSVKKEASVGVKRHPKFGKTTKAKERLTSEAVGPASIQSERMAQIRRTNLDTLKKILDKSLSAQNKPVKPEEANSAKVN